MKTLIIGGGKGGQALINLGSVDAPAGEMQVVLGPGWPGVLLHEAVGHDVFVDRAVAVIVISVTRFRRRPVERVAGVVDEHAVFAGFEAGVARAFAYAAGGRAGQRIAVFVFVYLAVAVVVYKVAHFRANQVVLG